MYAALFLCLKSLETGGYGFMAVDIRRIRLCRKAGSGANEIQNEGRDETSRFEMMATDYFDMLYVESRKLEDQFKLIMDVGINDTDGENYISLQSYPMYWDEKEFDSNELSAPSHGNPFDNASESTMPFLSIIQVHITPESFARLGGQSVDLMQEFYEDLYKILNEFVRDNLECRMVYRIYMALAVGDFSVVLKSEKADTSFQVSTRIR